MVYQAQGLTDPLSGEAYQVHLCSSHEQTPATGKMAQWVKALATVTLTI